MTNPRSSRSRQPAFNPINALWRFFCSVRVALILIIILAVTSFAGVIIQQAPVDVANSPAFFDQWVETFRGRYGFLTDIFKILGFFDVFNQLWFRAVMVLLGISIITCTLNRFPPYWRSLVSPRLKVSDSFFNTTRNRASCKARNATGLVRKALEQRRYKVTSLEEGEVTYLYADRFGWSNLLGFLAHLSLIIVLAGAILSGMTGFQREQVIAEGTTAPVYPVRDPNQIQVRVDEFVADFYEDGRPKDYYSDLVLFQAGREVKRGRIRVNEPLSYQGVKFHQAFYGPAAAVEVTSSQGNILLSETVPLTQRFDNLPIARVSVPTTDYDVVVWLETGRDGATRLGIVGLDRTRSSDVAFELSLGMGESVTAEGLGIRFLGPKEYSGLLIRKIPWENLIWLGCGLLVVGFSSSLFFSRQRIWVKVTPRDVSLAGIADRFANLKQELNDLSGEITAKLGTSGRQSGKTSGARKG